MAKKREEFLPASEYLDYLQEIKKTFDGMKKVLKESSVTKQTNKFIGEGLDKVISKIKKEEKKYKPKN